MNKTSYIFLVVSIFLLILLVLSTYQNKQTVMELKEIIQTHEHEETVSSTPIPDETDYPERDHDISETH